MKLRIGFIGVGNMGASHLEALHVGCAASTEAVALCGTNAQQLRRALAIAPRAQVFKSAEELIHSPLDAVVISTPNFTHARLGLEALRAGRDVYLEKPLGITGDECHQLLKATAETNRMMMIGHAFRYSPYFQRFKQLVQDGEVGRPHMVWCKEFRGPFQKKSQDWIEDQRRSGGAVLNRNCHHFDLMNWFVGAKPKHVSAFGRNSVNRVLSNGTQVLDHASVSFEYENGVIGSHQLCLFALDYPKEDLEMGVIGDRGMLVTRISQLQILLWRRGANQREPVVHVVNNIRRDPGWGSYLGFVEIHEAFVRSVRERSEPLTSVRNCVDGTLLAIGAEKAIKERRVVEVN